MSTDRQSATAEATLMVDRLRRGDIAAADQLLPLVYEQLRALAGKYFQRHSSEQTLQPTALVHEAYLKMVNAKNQDYRSSQHFCAVAATAMRQILANHAASKRAEKRGGDAKRLSLTHVTLADEKVNVDTIDLDDALRKLEAADEGLSRVVELLYFGGLQLESAAEVLGVSRSTVARRWRQARAFLNLELTQGDPS